MIPFLVEMKAIHDETIHEERWHDGRFDPPHLAWNIGINDHNAAVNVTAAKSICTVYFRPMPGMQVESLLERTRRAAEQNGLGLEIDRWGEPLFTSPDSPFVKEALALTHRAGSKTVPYGTDGGAYTELENLIVLGPGNIQQAHAIDEWISVEQLSHATELYTRFIRRFCGEPVPVA
jgi:acetylornithine deacetylase